MNNYYYDIVILETGKRGNRWSAITIRMGEPLPSHTLSFHYILCLSLLFSFSLNTHTHTHTHTHYLLSSSTNPPPPLITALARSPAAYRALQSFGLIQLPSKATMQAYTGKNTCTVYIIKFCHTCNSSDHVHF